MTFAEKMKKARTEAGLSQESLAEKLCVSRQAITKWECGKGLPDIENLKAISSLLNVSIDYLLDEGSDLDMRILTETIVWEKYPKPGLGRLREDLVVLDKYPDALSIVTLERKKIPTRAQKFLDAFFLWFTDAPDSGADIVDAFQDRSVYYLVTLAEGYFFVNVTKEHIISRRLPDRMVAKKMEIGENRFCQTKRDIKKERR